MKLIWFIYNSSNPKKRNRRRPILGIFLGQIYNKIHILESKNVPEEDALLIRLKIEQLKLMIPVERMRWLRGIIPNTFGKTYKTIANDNMTVLESMDIGPLSKIEEDRLKAILKLSDKQFEDLKEKL